MDVRYLGKFRQHIRDWRPLDAVIQETLRSRPVAHEVPRVLAQDGVRAMAPGNVPQFRWQGIHPMPCGLD